MFYLPIIGLHAQTLVQGLWRVIFIDCVQDNGKLTKIIQFHIGQLDGCET